MYYTTSNFSKGLINAIIGYMTENRVSVLPMYFLASGKNGFPETAEIAKVFIERGHWDYFFVKNGLLMLHVNYRGEYGLGEYDYEVVDTPRPYPNNANTTCIMTEDLVNLIRVVYDTIGNVHFTKNLGVETFDCSEIDELEAEYEARRNEVA